ncbi:MAG: BatA domain-containing protein [Planctomycetaceae bacterium]|nr:BatA domain-containing protein [Planctomycetaceae bacterium]
MSEKSRSVWPVVENWPRQGVAVFLSYKLQRLVLYKNISFLIDQLGFLTFSFLIGGMAAAAVPILLHLIMRGVPKRIEFPPLRFLLKKQKINQRKFRLRHLLLLALRIGVFVLIGFALARPSLRLDGSGGGGFAGHFGSQQAPIAAAIVIDNSPRMDYQHANKTRLELAKTEARWVLSQLPEQSQVAVLSNTRMNDMFQVDLFTARERIDRLSTTRVGRSVGESVAAAIRLLQTSELESREIYVFTDLTEAGWPQEAINSVRSQLGEIGVYVVDLGVESPNNSGIVKLDLSAEVLSDQSSLQLDLEIAHFGKADSRIVELLTFHSDRQEQRRASEVVEFPGTSAPNEKMVQNLRFHLPNLSPGIHQGAVRFSTSDGFEADDMRFFTVEVQSAWKVLLVAQEPVERNALFLREAIDPTVFRKQGGSSFQTDAINFGTFRTMKDSQWNDYRAVFLLDPPPLDAPLWKRLTDFAAAGHGVGVFLGRKATPIASFQTAAAMELFGAKPVRQVPRSDDPGFFSQSQRFEQPDFEGISSARRRESGSLVTSTGLSVLGNERPCTSNKRGGSFFRRSPGDSLQANRSRD